MKTMLVERNLAGQEYLTVRFLTTADGIGFLSLSSGGGAFTISPGSVLSLIIQPTIISVQMPYNTAPNYSSGTSGFAPCLSISLQKSSEEEQ